MNIRHIGRILRPFIGWQCMVCGKLVLLLIRQAALALGEYFIGAWATRRRFLPLQNKELTLHDVG